MKYEFEDGSMLALQHTPPVSIPKWQTTKIFFKPEEYVTVFSGRGQGAVDSIYIQTNTGRTFGPFGGSGGQQFGNLLPKGGRLIGFGGGGFGNYLPETMNQIFVYFVQGLENKKANKSNKESETKKKKA